MAERRMFAKTIVTSDAFLDMPLSARCLYFTLGMFADDDGFVNAPKSIMRQVGSSTDDLNLLLLKRFIIAFESGVIVIKHWRIHNYIQKDRYKETKYIKEKASIMIDEKGAYTECIQDVSKLDTQDRIGKDRLELGKDSVGEDRRGETAPPSLHQIEEYITSRGLNVNPDRFYNYYSNLGWKTTQGTPIVWTDKLEEWSSKEKQSKPTGSGNPFLDRLRQGGYDDD